MDTLRAVFDVVQVRSRDELQRILRDSPDAIVLGQAIDLRPSVLGAVSARALLAAHADSLSQNDLIHAQALLNAIEELGAELLQIDASQMATLNMADRLQQVMSLVTAAVKRILHYEHFEFRLINRRTGQLELVAAIGISPLRIGETISVGAAGNGISGYVAATGRSYICADVKNDPLYREGLDQASSTLTVPLRLHDRVIGVFNIESSKPRSFGEVDRIVAELLGHYVATALNVLELLVVERYTTSEQISSTVLEELSPPLDDIALAAAAIRDASGISDMVSHQAGQILSALDQVRSRVRNCTSGPQTILAADQALRRHERDPRMAGKRILVADDQPGIRETVGKILRNRGAEVTLCSTGMQTLDELTAAHAGGSGFDLVISDIKMPDRNGYEVFRATKAVSPSTPVILMTGFGYDPHHCIVRASQEGMHCFLFKPFKASQLLDEVAKALASSAPVESGR